MPAKRDFVSYNEASVWAQASNIQTLDQWLGAARPKNVPANPDKVYRGNGWNGWGAFLGTGRMANFNRTFVLYAEASAWAKANNIQSLTQWRKAKLPSQIPSNPHRTYHSNWTTWGDFLQTGTVANRFAITTTYGEVSKWAIEHDITSAAQYWRWSAEGRLPTGFPHSPHTVFKGKGLGGLADLP